MMVKQDLANTGDDLKFKMAAMPIYGKKTFKGLLLQNHGVDLADILHEAYGTLSYVKKLK